MENEDLGLPKITSTNWVWVLGKAYDGAHKAEYISSLHTVRVTFIVDEGWVGGLEKKLN